MVGFKNGFLVSFSCIEFEGLRFGGIIWRCSSGDILEYVGL